MNQVLKRIFFVTLLVALVFLEIGPGSPAARPQPVQAGTGATITVPTTTLAPVGGPCTTASWADATNVQIAIPDPNYPNFKVYLVFDSSYLYVCFSLMPLPKTGNSGFVGIYIDRDNDGGANDPDDYFVGIHPDGTPVSGYWNPSSGTFDAAISGDWSASSEKCLSGCEWASAYFRISRKLLGGWQHTVGMALFYHWYRFVGDDYSWPARYIWANPDLYGNAALYTGNIQIDQSSVTPTVDGLCGTGPNSEYADAVVVNYPMGAFGNPVKAYLKHTATDLYVCLDNLYYAFWGDPTNAAVFINQLGTGGDSPGSGDIEFNITVGGAVSAHRGGAFGFDGPDPGGYTVARQYVGGELLQWSAEFRISAATLGGGWNRNINIAVASQSITGPGVDRGWPQVYSPLLPNTWAVAHLSSAAAVTKTDIYTTGMEVTQSIQDLNNDVVLIEDKRTFVRVYVAATIDTTGVTARLYGYRNGISLGGPLIPINPGGVINVTTTPSRDSINDSFLFELPASWIINSPDSLNLTADINPSHAIPEYNYTNNAISANRPLIFETATELDLVLENYQYQRRNGDWVTNPARDLDMLKSEIRRMYPINTLKYGERTYTHYGRYLSICPHFPWICMLDTPNTLAVFTELENDKFPEIYPSYYAMVYDRGDQGDNPGTGFIRGMGLPVLGVAVGPNGPASWGWDTDGSYGDWYGAHEIAHTLWRHHTLCFDEPAPYQNYPYPNATLGAQFAGFDAGDSALNVPMRVMPGSSWHDIMSYCGNQWTSDITYNGLRHFIETGLPGAPVKAPAGLGESTVASQGNFLIVAGILDLQHQVAGFTKLAKQATSGYIPITPGGYHIRLLDGANKTLADYDFTPQVNPDQDQTATFYQVVNFVAGTQRIAIYSDSAKREIASAAVSAHPPVVSISSRSGGASLPSSGPVTLAWNASDADGDALSYAVQYSFNGGKSWRTLLDGLTASSITLDSSQLEGTAGVSTGTLRVIANDGVLTAIADSDAFSVAGKAPVATLSNPAGGSSYVYGQNVTLEGYGQDFEDGTLAGSHLTWVSDRDGNLGTGHLVTAALLSVGVHHITLTATDSNGQTGSATVTITVGAVATPPAPSLDVSPSNLFFSGTLGSQSPAAQLLAIRNPGSGAINWTASTSAGWITLSASSGTAPANLTVSVRMDGPWTSRYRTGQITISAPGTTQAPLTIKVTEEALNFQPRIFLPFLRK
ncbi:MAG: hypothetical protein M1570_04500 [Chloroflexi bacterium]|nr:hypothetical protein [Chloroflexota bacterium]